MKKTIFIILLMLALAGCAKKDDSSAAVKPVETFYNDIVEQNRENVSNITCSEWESDAIREVDSFMGVKTEMNDFSCKLDFSNGDEAQVSCNGSISASYGNEVTEFPLNNREHTVIKEDGEWRICGY